MGAACILWCTVLADWLVRSQLVVLIAMAYCDGMIVMIHTSLANMTMGCALHFLPLPPSTCRAALSSNWSSKVAFDASARIPMQLWQTSSSKQLGERAGLLRLIWQGTNPGMETHLMDDSDAAAFIKTFYGQELLQVYSTYPMAVMRADLWRLAILLAYGGIYADIDTKCLRPVRMWFPPRRARPEDPLFVSRDPAWSAAGPLQYHKLTWDDCGLVASVEEVNNWMCQWIIAAVPGHPVLQAAIRIALQRVQDGFDCTEQDMVHEHTGPALWTQAFREVLGLPNNMSAADIAVAAWTDSAVYERARQLQICIVAFTFWGAPYGRPSGAQNADNQYSSKWIDDKPNTPWRQEGESVRAAAAAAAAGAGAGFEASVLSRHTVPVT